MYPNLHPKCANPTCAAAFEWLKGGKIFRFQRRSPGPAKSGAVKPVDARRVRSRKVEHFWLCASCSFVYTLDYQPDRGVVIRLLREQLPPAVNKMPLPVA